MGCTALKIDFSFAQRDLKFCVEEEFTRSKKMGQNACIKSVQKLKSASLWAKVIVMYQKTWVAIMSPQLM